jgi:hypothetical protein
MPIKQYSKLLTKLVLVWFVMFVGASIAASIFKPTASQVICSSAGVMKMVSTDDGSTEIQTSSGMECPLCATVATPLPPASPVIQKPCSLAHVLQPIAAAHIISATAPPLPSRGPPSFL